MVAEVEQKKETLPGAGEMFNVFGGEILEIGNFFIHKIVIQIIRIFFYDNYNDFIVI